MLLKRAGITALELVTEALLLGLLLGLVLGAYDVRALAVGSLPVVVVLYLHGYYFTRPILGLLWKAANFWMYGVIASILFTCHMGIGYSRLRPDMKQVGIGAVITFFVAGAGIVFGCAAIGHGLLLKNQELRTSSHSQPG